MRTGMEGMAAVEPLAAARNGRLQLSGLQVGLLLAAALAVSMAYGVTLPLLPALVERLDGGPAADVARHTGWLTGAFTLALCVFSPAWGALSDRLDRRAVIAFGLVGGGVALWGLDRAESLAGLYIARIAAGTLSAAVLPAVLAYLADVSAPQRRQSAFAWVASSTALGFLLGPVIGHALREMAGTGPGPMVRAYGMPDSPFTLVAVVCVLSALAAAALPANDRRVKPMQADARQPGKPSIPMALLLTAFVVFGITIAEVGITLIARDSRVLQAQQVPAYFALCSGVMVVVQLWAYPWLEQSIGERRLVTASLAVMSVAIALLAWPMSGWVPVAAFALAAGGIGVLIPALATRTSTAAGSRQGWALGRQAAAANLGQAVGAAVTGVLYAVAAPVPFVVAGLVLGAGSMLAASVAGEDDKRR